MASHDTNPSPDSAVGGFDDAAFGDPQLEARLTQHFASEADATGVDLSALAARVASVGGRTAVPGVPPTGASLRVASGGPDRRGSGGLASAWSFSRARHSGFQRVGRQPDRFAGDGLADVDLLTRDIVVRERAISNLSGVADFECELEALFPEAEFRCDS